MNRSELLAYAKTLPPSAHVQSILLGIEEATAAATTAVFSIKTLITCIDACEGTHHEAENMTQYAVKYERAHAQLSMLFMTLATTLQGRGHPIDY